MAEIQGHEELLRSNPAYQAFFLRVDGEPTLLAEWRRGRELGLAEMRAERGRLAQGEVERSREQGRLEGHAQAAAAERERLDAILTYGVENGCYDLALSLGLDTDLPAEDCLAVLRRAPKAAAPAETAARAVTDFAEHMRQLRASGVPAGLSAQEYEEQQAVDTVRRLVAERA